MLPTLAISVVFYMTPAAQAARLLDNLSHAVANARQARRLGVTTLILIDNSADAGPLQAVFAQAPRYAVFDDVQFFSRHGNIGYGAGHNKALHNHQADYYLVLNPDIELQEQALLQALSFMQNHGDAGLLAPAVFDGNDRQQYLCRRYPTVFDLLLRGFAPAAVRGFFSRRLARYELRDDVERTNPDAALWDVPLVSGCFMLLRDAVVKQTRGFCPAYFLYFEDYDLSLRSARAARTVYVPAVRIRHYGGYAAKKGWRHIIWFIRSATLFFNRHGWAWY